jgi:multiple sugar transport system permease protein
MRRSTALPFLTGAGLLVGLPALAALFLSFTDYSGIGAPSFTGFDNYTRLLEDELFRRAVGNTLLHVLMSVPLRMLLIGGLALYLHHHFRGSSVARAGVYLPTVVPDVALTLLFLWLLNPLYGPFAAVLGRFNPAWLTDPWGARWAVVLVTLLQIGEGFVIALAARRALPEYLFEAARVDGASPWFVLRRVTLPLMAPVLAVLALRDVVLSLQVNFVPALLLTDGGPSYATTYIPLYAYRQAFRYLRLGYVSAMSVVMFAFTALVIYLQYRMARKAKLI